MLLATMNACMIRACIVTICKSEQEHKDRPGVLDCLGRMGSCAGAGGCLDTRIVSCKWGSDDTLPGGRGSQCHNFPATKVCKMVAAQGGCADLLRCLFKAS